MLIAPGFYRNSLTAQARRFATCWKATPKSGTILYLTGHSTLITLDGVQYSPMGGTDPSTARRQGALKEHDREFRGVITSDKIKDEDLRAGRWDGALVEEFVVDWGAPSIPNGWIRKAAYYIADLTHDGAIWRASTVGLVRWLQGPQGDIYGRHCRHELGVTKPDGDGCPVILSSVTLTGVSPTGFGDGGRRLQIRGGAVSGTYVDGWFAGGKFAVTSGANVGQIRDVKTYTQATREFELQNPLPFAMATSDTFSVSFGCDKRVTTCKTKFNVFVAGNGGFDTMPGTDGILGIRPAA